MGTAASLKRKLTTGAVGVAKRRLAKYVAQGGVELPLACGQILSVSEEDPNFEAKSICALTIGRASFQHKEFLDESMAARALGIDSLPSGFYAMADTPSGKAIAAAYLPEESGSASSPFDEFAAMKKALTKAGVLATGCFATRFEVDVESFARARDPLADYMSIGAGLTVEEKALAREASRGESLKEFGLRIFTAWEGQISSFGYPAPLELMGKSLGQSYDGPLAKKHMILNDVAVVGVAAQMGRLPIFNHDAASAINNTRDIQEARDRVEERKAIVESMVDAWMARLAILAGAMDQKLGLASLSSNDKMAMRELAAEREVKSFGKERKLFVAQSKSAIHDAPNGNCRLLMSMEMALVDGQHSSRDYALIAQGCELAGSPEAPKYAGAIVPDVSPARLREAVWARYVENSAHGLDPLGLLSKGREQIGETKDAAWFAFAKFAPSIPVKVEISATSDPEMSRMYALMENQVREQSPEAKAMAKHHSSVALAVSRFNDVARLSGDTLRLAAVKSQHGNPDVSTCDNPGISTLEFSEIFPYLSAVCNPEKVSSLKTGAKGEAALEKAKNWGRWEALALLDECGRGPKSIEEPEFVELSKRLASLYLGRAAYQVHNFDLADAKLAKTLAALSAPSIKGSRHKAFAAMVEKHAAEYAKAAGKPALTASERVYTLVKLAMALKESLRPEALMRVGTLDEVIGEKALDNIGLAMLMGRFSAFGEQHPAGLDAREALKCMRERLMSFAQDSSGGYYQAKQALLAQVKDRGGESYEPEPFPSARLIASRTRDAAKEYSHLLAIESKSSREILLAAIPGVGEPFAKASLRQKINSKRVGFKSNGRGDVRLKDGRAY